MDEDKKATKELDLLRKEHKELDSKIQSLLAQPLHDQLFLQRLKRRKLWLKDKIASLESSLYDDIIA